MRFFCWTPKTAGGTTALGIKSNPQVQWPAYPFYPSPDVLPPPSSGQLWSGGHTAYGLHLIYNAEPIYLTVLRDPVERLVSEFFYHHQHPLPGVFIPDDELVPAFIRMIEAAAHLNVYSYTFSDYCFRKESIEAGLGPWNGRIDTAFDLLGRRNKRLGYLTENISFDRIDVDESFRKASDNVRAMRFIGFFDQIEVTAVFLKEEFGLNIDLEGRIHKTRWMPRVKDLPRRIQAMLKRKTEADREFFHEARNARCPRRRWSPLGRSGSASMLRLGGN